ncbi:MAG: hemolysin family protein [Chitinivibrionales bacterium]
MDTDTTVFYVILFAVSYLFTVFFNIIPILLSPIDKDSIPHKDDRMRYFASKVEELFKNNILFHSSVITGRITSLTVLILSGLPIIQNILEGVIAENESLVVISAILLIVFIILFVYLIPDAAARNLNGKYLIPLYSVYRLIAAVFYFPAYIFSLIYRLFINEKSRDFIPGIILESIPDVSNIKEMLDFNEREMIRNIYEFGETTVDEIMQPRVDIKALEINTNYQTAIKTIKEAGHSRIPVYRKDIDSIAGILYAKDILAFLSKDSGEEWNLEKIIKEPFFVPAGKKVGDLLHEMKKNQVHIVIVVDEYGGTSGIVTFEDVIEEIVGDIRDEYDLHDQMIKKTGKGTYIVKSHTELDDLRDYMDIELDIDQKEYNTLGGLVYHEYGEVPEEGTEFSFMGLNIKVIKMNKQKIELIRVEIAEAEEY